MIAALQYVRTIPDPTFSKLTARCVSIWDICVTNGSIPQIGKTSVADDAAQTEPGGHRRPFGGHGPSHGHHARWI